MEQSFTSWENELCHHGIKGQKWGVRNYQRKDGSLTAEGAAKYGNNFGRKADRYQEKAKKFSHYAKEASTWKNTALGKDAAKYEAKYAKKAAKMQQKADNARKLAIGDRSKLTKNRKENVEIFGKRGADRIDKRVKLKGMTVKQATRREVLRSGLASTGARIAGMAAADQIFFNGAGRKALGAVLKSTLGAGKRSAGSTLLKLSNTPVNAIHLKKKDYSIS